MKKSFTTSCLLLVLTLTPFAVVDSVQSETAMCMRLFDYQIAKGESTTSWRMVNDDVMGGKSIGRVLVTNNALSFSGVINTNGGGFSSMRHLVTPHSFNEADLIRMSVRSDGRPYTLNLADEVSAQQGISYRARIQAQSGSQFQVVSIGLSDLRPMFRGRMVQAPKLDTTRIRELGIMLSDTVDGKFLLEIAWIDVCR